jgi:hypothetical protein
MPNLAKTQPKRDLADPASPPTISVVTGFMANAVDDVSSELHRLDGIYRHQGALVRARLGLAIELEAVPFSAFLDALGRAFVFQSAKIRDNRLHTGAVIDVPPRLARILFESPKYWTEIPEISCAADLMKAGAA